GRTDRCSKPGARAAAGAIVPLRIVPCAASAAAARRRPFRHGRERDRALDDEDRLSSTYRPNSAPGLVARRLPVRVRLVVLVHPPIIRAARPIPTLMLAVFGRIPE